MTVKFKSNILGGWFVIRVGEYQENLLGEIKYVDPNGPDLDVTFRSKSDLFKEYPEDLQDIQAFMRSLLLDASR